jgi:hypothetical protein
MLSSSSDVFVVGGTELVAAAVVGKITGTSASRRAAQQR